ncbi:MAG: Vancomycin B-type resistance protein VanW, partial [uncultured Thermomicrobiales bacterium]
AGRIYRGVGAAGVERVGLTRDEAVARLDERATAYTERPVPVRAARGVAEWAVVPADLGVRLDPAAAVDAAFAAGRGGNPVRNALAWSGALVGLGDHDVPVPATLDGTALEATVRAWAPDVTYWPTNATFTVRERGELAVVPDKDGLGIDLEGGRAAFLGHAARLSGRPVELPTSPVRADITAPTLDRLKPEATAATAMSLTLRLNDREWTLESADLRAALIAYRWDRGFGVALDPARLRPFLDELAADVAQPGTNATLAPDASGRYLVTPGRDGLVLDEAVTLTAAAALLNAGGPIGVGVGGERVVPVSMRLQPPPIVAADLEPVRARVETVLETPLVVSFAGQPIRTFRRADLAPLIRLTPQPDATEKMTVTLDPAGVRALSLRLAGDFNQSVRDAEFKFLNRAVRDVVSSRDGRDVQLVPTGQALSAAILGADGALTLREGTDVLITKPQVATADKAKMVVTDLLGRGRTNYGFRDDNGAHNVENAARLLNGILVPPSETFSFNRDVGPQTAANGYKDGYGIELVDGGARTFSTVAGGVCQVSTTLFHGAFRAGLPIEDRSWHLYWVTYAESSTGMKGLDATVYDDSGIDFQFVNTSGGWLGIEATANGEDVQVSIFGQDPGWEVRIDGPEISNERKADRTPIYEKTHDVPPGQRKQQDFARDGFDSAIRRRVYAADGSLLVVNTGNGPQPMDTTFRSNYLAARSIIQIGVPANESLDGPPVVEPATDGQSAGN